MNVSAPSVPSAALLICVICGPRVATQPVGSRPVQFDVILRSGTIVDGTGGSPFVADVGIVGQHIARVGKLSQSTAALELDVSGLHVAPGFINIHSHASSDALPTAENMLTQGVTTEILNPDGGGPTEIAPQLERLGAAGLALNVGAYIGFNSLWTMVVGTTDRRPTDEDIKRMRELLITGLEGGAWGVSAGLDYKPAYFATSEEVIAVVSAATSWRTNFTNHDRLTPDTKYSSRAGMLETLAIGRRANLLPVVTHMKVQGREQGTAAETLQMMGRTTAGGRYAAADAYPYLAGQSGLGALIIPGWAQDGGREKMLERFKDPALRARIVSEAEAAMAARFGGPQGVFLPATRRELADVMQEMDVPAGEAVVRLLEEDNVGAILRFGAEPDLVKILQHPSTSIACDCGAAIGTRGHPRYYGSYPRVLGRYVRGTNALTLSDAVRKMTMLPAATIGIIDRGTVVPGMVADITVFDAKTVIDRATFEEPALPSEGIRHVFVNGGLALRDGKATGERHGRVLRRTRHMPSRAFGPSTRRLSARGAVAGEGHGAQTLQVVIDVSQDAIARRAKGGVRLIDSTGKTAIETTELGLLQVADGWSSVTGRARVLPKDEERTVLVVVEQADPTRPDREPTVIVTVDSAFEASGRLAPSRVKITARPR